MQQDKDSRNTSKSTTEGLKKKRIKVLRWPSQTPDLNLIETLWRDLKRRMLANINEVKKRYKGEWAGIPA